MNSAWLVAGLVLVGCGGSSFTGEGSGGSGGNAGAGGSAGAGATAGTGGSGASGGSGGSSGSGGTGGVSLSRCEVASNCVVVPKSCCGRCGAAAGDDAVSVNADRAADYRDLVCDANVGCPDCYLPTDPNLIATCVEGQCQVVNLQQHDSTRCNDSRDCFLRTNECCSCGGSQDGEHLVAVSDPSFTGLVCDPNAACAGCEPLPPADAEAVCTNGRCQVNWLFD